MAARLYLKQGLTKIIFCSFSNCDIIFYVKKQNCRILPAAAAEVVAEEASDSTLISMLSGAVEVDVSKERP